MNLTNRQAIWAIGIVLLLGVAAIALDGLRHRPAPAGDELYNEAPLPDENALIREEFDANMTDPGKL